MGQYDVHDRDCLYQDVLLRYQVLVNTSLSDDMNVPHQAKQDIKPKRKTYPMLHIAIEVSVGI